MPASRAPVHRVTLLLLAPDAQPVRRADAEALLQVLAVPGDAAPWRRLSAHVRDGAGLVLEVVRDAAEGSDERTAAREVVDRVRARLGLDAVFARWVVDARHVQVREVAPDA